MSDWTIDEAEAKQRITELELALAYPDQRDRLMKGMYFDDLIRERDWLKEVGATLGKEINALKHDLTEVQAELHDYDLMFDQHHKRMVIAERAWREAHPGNDLRLPDLGTLIQWFLDERDRLREALQTIVAGTPDKATRAAYTDDFILTRLDIHRLAADALA